MRISVFDLAAIHAPREESSGDIALVVDSEKFIMSDDVELLEQLQKLPFR